MRNNNSNNNNNAFYLYGGFLSSKMVASLILIIIFYQWLKLKCVEGDVVSTYRMQDINAEKVTFKASILRLLQTFVRVVKQRLFQHYAQVMVRIMLIFSQNMQFQPFYVWLDKIMRCLFQNIYKTEEDQLKRMMQDLMKRMEEGMLRLRQIEEETMDVKRMLARKTEVAHN